MQPWNDWYHLTAHTYGTWLYGDRRGWRTRHHREHVEGDYKHPPAPGTFEDKLRRSKKLMKRPPVCLPVALRAVVLQCLIDKLRAERIEAVCACMTRDHLHMLARCPDHDPRHWLGLAKKHASHELRDRNLRTDPGGIWGVRCKVEPIRDRSH